MDFQQNKQSNTFIEVRQEQVMHLYAKTGLGFWGNIIIGVILALVLSFQIKEEQTLQLFIWFGLIVATSIYRFIITNNFHQERINSKERINYWASRYINISTLINIIWGSIGVFFFPHQMQYQGFLFLSLLSILLSSMPLLALSRRIYYLQVAIVLLPIAFYILWVGDKDYYIMALALFISAISLFAASNYIYDLLFQLQNTQAKLLQQANTDQLTQVSNRRQYDQTFKTEWRRCSREDLPISMLLIDVDYFKKYNDRFGHLKGDDCLQQVASRLSTISRRPGDLAARHGGEEFAVLLPNTSLENAVMLAERFRRIIQSLDIKHPDSEYNVLTVSIGVSSCDPMQRDNRSNDVIYPAMLMNSADNAMYLAKRQGRNCVATQGCGEQKIANILHQEALKDENRAKAKNIPQPA